MSGSGLSGLGIVVTRPAAQASRLSGLLRGAGAQPIEFPCIEIAPLADSASLADALARLAAFDMAIFISPSAVNAALDAVQAAGITWPPGLGVAVVGPGSRRALESRGFSGVVAPATRYDSEGLLASPALRDVSGKRIVIFRGKGGRELLADELRRRGADVVHAECYERRLPNADASSLLARWQSGRVAAIVFTSSQAVQNFVRLTGGRLLATMADTPVFVTHERIAAAASAAGFSHVIRAGAGDEGLTVALKAHFA